MGDHCSWLCTPPHRMNPNYAMSLFKKRCGLTIRGYLAHLRVTHAQRLLLEGNAKVADVALESGFATLSAFYDAFASRVKMSPRQFQSRYHAGTPRTLRPRRSS